MDMIAWRLIFVSHLSSQKSWFHICTRMLHFSRYCTLNRDLMHPWLQHFQLNNQKLYAQASRCIWIWLLEGWYLSPISILKSPVSTSVYELVGNSLMNILCLPLIKQPQSSQNMGAFRIDLLNDNLLKTLHIK